MSFKIQGPRKKRGFSFSVLILGALLFCRPVSANEPLYTLSARVSDTDPEHSSFSAYFRHPATGENLEYLFKVTDRTGMNGLKEVGDLKLNDILQIDYFKTADGSLIVEYMAIVKMRGAPDGLEKFNPADLFKKQ